MYSQETQAWLEKARKLFGAIEKYDAYSGDRAIINGRNCPLQRQHCMNSKNKKKKYSDKNHSTNATETPQYTTKNVITTR
jgi:hypothetical protein